MVSYPEHLSTITISVPIEGFFRTAFQNRSVLFLPGVGRPVRDETAAFEGSYPVEAVINWKGGGLNLILTNPTICIQLLAGASRYRARVQPIIQGS
jgi:hypothetical protein